MTVFIWLIVKNMLFHHEFRVFRQFMFIKKAAHGIQIRVHSAGFADGLAWLFGRFKTADKVFGDFTHATQRNVRRIFFLIGGEKAGVEANQRGLGQWDWQSVRGPASAHAFSENAASVQGSPLRKTGRRYSIKACRAFRRLWRRRPREAFPDKIRRVCAGG